MRVEAMGMESSLGLGGVEVDGEKQVPHSRFARVRNDNDSFSGEAVVNERLDTGGITIMAMADPREWRRRRGLPKRMGELSEAEFLLKASSKGFGVAKPWGESERYDFIVSGRRGGMSRVQVKSTACRYGRGYSANSCCGGAGKSGYTEDDIDFLVVHVRPVDVWYVLPVKAFAPVKHLNFYPGAAAAKRERWEKYREAWELLETEK